MPKAHPVGWGLWNRARYPAEPVEDDGSAPSVVGADGGDVVVDSPDVPPEVSLEVPSDAVVPPSGVAVPDGVDEAECPFVAETVAEGEEVSVGGGAEVVAPVGDAVGEGLGPGAVPVVGPGLVAGHGWGALGSSWTPEWGHRKRPRQSPAAATTPPAARWAARTRRRACTPARSRSRCLGSNATGSRSPCINCVNCRSK
ncbi:hypothetical protein ACGFZQ_49600 [Streptomyces sp. NPDC048254]|uniref:hypothetical protein n=1 Tax=Streptomyces sp. NPDC048254 TaxID=3365525 RepID=UPI003719193C